MTLSIAPWVRAVPPGWQLRRLRRIGRTASGSGFPPDLQGETALEIPFYKVKHLGQADGRGVLSRADDTIDRSTAARLGATIFPSGTLVYAKVGAALMLGRVRTLPGSACIDNNMAGFMPSDDVHARFLYWAMTQVRFDYLVNPGAVPSLSDKNLLDHPVILPPLDAQRAIADYLDRETIKIDELIDGQLSFIGILNERRAAMIANATTKGLDPAAPLKDSGLGWVGMAPSHWSIVPHRSVLAVRKSEVGTAWDETPLLSLTKRGIVTRDIESGEGKYPASFEGYQVVEPNDLIFCLFDMDETPRTVGRAKQRGMITSAYTRFVVDSRKADPQFLEWYFIGVDDGKRYRPLYTGLRKVIQKPRFMSASMVLPPLGEQTEIAQYLNEQTVRIDELVAEAEGIIAVAKERRSALITAAVTGQIDVCGEVA